MVCRCYAEAAVGPGMCPSRQMYTILERRCSALRCGCASERCSSCSNCKLRSWCSIASSSSPQKCRIMLRVAQTVCMSEICEFFRMGAFRLFKTNHEGIYRKQPRRCVHSTEATEMDMHMRSS
jgi:hypothetical protein